MKTAIRRSRCITPTLDSLETRAATSHLTFPTPGMFVGDAVLGTTHKRGSVSISALGSGAAGDLVYLPGAGSSIADSDAHISYTNVGNSVEIAMRAEAIPLSYNGATAQVHTTSSGYNGPVGFVTVQVNASNASEHVGQRVLVSLTGTLTVHSDPSHPGYISGQISYITPTGQQYAMISAGGYYSYGSQHTTAQFYANIGGSFRVAMVDYASANTHYAAAAELDLKITVH
jgi:hypothetical protein